MMDFDPAANSKEYLWSAKLDKKKNKSQWEGRDDGVLEQLVLKRACLGVGAKQNERNIVQVTSFNYQQKKIETCICSLTLPTNECDGLTDVTIFPPAIFELVEGSGPVHLTGNHMMMDDGDESDDEDFDEEGVEEDEEEDVSDEEEEEEEDEAKVVEVKSDEAPAKVNGVAEKKQVAEVKPQVKDDAPAAAEVEEEKEEAMEAEEAEPAKEEVTEEAAAEVVEEEKKEEEKPKKTPKKNKKRKLEEKAAEENVEEKPKTPAKKKKAPAADAEEAPKTPKNKKEKENKTPKKTPAKVYATLDEVAAAVKKYPGGKPRKEDKFGNWVKSAFKVHNEEWIPQLWKMHKKEQGL